MARELGDEMDVRVIHLVRDPRGFVGSWWHHHKKRDPRPVAGWWVEAHARARRLERVMPYKLVRYRDLASDPETATRELFEFLGVEPESVVGPPRYPHKHHLIGNNMLTTFKGEVRLDERWRSELSLDEQQAILRVAGETAERCDYA